jgi:hypothetical protein
MAVSRGAAGKVRLKKYLINKGKRMTPKHSRSLIFALLASLACIQSVGAKPTQAQSKSVPVTIDNFVRADTDHYFKGKVERAGIGAWAHDREPTPVDKQNIIRMNRDTPYSQGVFDLTTPVTIVKPDTKGRYQSILVINEDHYIKRVLYEPGTYTFTKEEMGTRYIQMTVRTFVNPEDPKDLAELHRVQDATRIIQKNPGKLELPDWDQTQLVGLRKAILTMAPWVPDSKGMFGKPDEVNPVRHLIGTAGGFGGLKEEDAIYLNKVPQNNDGKTPYALTVKDVPVDAFWSVIVYNKEGYFEAPTATTSVNSVTAKKNADGATTIHFGGDSKASNYLRIMPGWNYMVRLYRPRKEVLGGTWKFPTAEAVK